VKEENAYILGTDTEELKRLGLQHQVWSSEAQAAYKSAGFGAGQTLLDLGCGPGFVTRELAFIVGDSGKVIGVDKSQAYINHLNRDAEQNGLNIQGICSDFDDLQLTPNSLDGIYCRWALAWIPNPQEVINKLLHALKPGGKLVFHEYYDWSTHQTEPALPGLNHAITQCLKSFKEQPGDIDVGRYIPKYLSEAGCKILSTKPLLKMAQSRDLIWQWPKSFYHIYFPKLVEMGYLSPGECEQALDDVQHLEQNPSATLCCPMVIEIIAKKC
jgi:ubiquinone/menaquinone biosynthesis C-methylase UbiE